MRNFEETSTNKQEHVICNQYQRNNYRRCHKKKTTEWYRNIKRMLKEKLPKVILKWMPTKQRKRTRPKKMWNAKIKKVMSEKNFTDEVGNEGGC